MPRKRTQEKPPGMVLGIVGGADISQENFDALLDDLTSDVEADELQVYVVAQAATPAAEAAVEWCRTNEVAFTAISPGGRQSKAVKAITDAASKHETSSEPIDSFVATLKNAAGDVRVLSAYDGDDSDDDDNESYRALEAAENAGLKTFNLVQGLDPLAFDDDPSSDEPQPEPEPEQPKASTLDPEVDYATAADYPLRKLRAYAIGRVDGGSQMSKAELLAALFPDEAEPAAAAEPEAADEAQASIPFVPRSGAWVTDAEAMTALVTLQTYLGQAGKNPPGRPRKDGLPAGQTKRGKKASEDDE